MNLNVFISKSGYCSRRKADSLIKASKVAVGGSIVTKPYHVVGENTEVFVDGVKINLKKSIYIIFNKPKGVTTSCSDIFADKCVTDFFPKEYKGIFPVGRLDRDTSGLLLLTNDGDLCYRVTHPKFEIEKEYSVILRGKFNMSDSRRAQAGIKDEEDLLRVKKVNVLVANTEKSICNVIVCEGKKRHLRRLFNALGYYVLGLERIRIGNLKIGNLKEGEYKMGEKEKIYHLLFGAQRLK